MQRIADDDWVAEIGDWLPVSPVSALGFVLAATIGVRIAGESASSQALLESVFPLVTATAVVLAYALGGFLAAVIVTALHLYIAYLEGTGAHAPLYLLLMGGTMGVGAGTVAGVFDSKQRAATREARRQSDRLEEFVSVVSHDLRNPLSVAHGRLDAAFRTGSADHLKEVDASLQPKFWSRGTRPRGTVRG
ncbi:integral membrane sensor signal transduction histidine kinase [Natronorubrum tibetense]|uniref:integral membrane sensor signal transduction histidine kinase n=1 Tax=Natronorubrum tibetense TaxID=63128 RepID=UPI000ACA0AAF|nr:integral membrane sensor signal transduction histidine kinase [Natronorubrum tibetense]